jgi:enoyl-CoA hydratase/carnithine racemase
MCLDVASQVDFINTHKASWMEGAGGKAFCAGGDVKALFLGEATAEDRINFFKY